MLTTIQIIGQNMVKLAECTPGFSSINVDNKILKGVIDERTSRFLFEFYLLRILLSYTHLADDENMIVTEVIKEVEETELFSVDYMDDNETKIDLAITPNNKKDVRITSGNKKELKQKTADLLISFIHILKNEKELVNITYEEIQDRVFKLKETEKDMVTDRLKAMTDEERDTDTLFKITKQGLYSKGLQKGFTVYDKDFYEEEQLLRDEMAKAENKIRRKNKNANDENIDMLVDDYLEDNQVEKGIDEDAYNMEYLSENYYDGNYDGAEQEYDTYAEEY